MKSGKHARLSELLPRARKKWGYKFGADRLEELSLREVGGLCQVVALVHPDDPIAKEALRRDAAGVVVLAEAASWSVLL